MACGTARRLRRAVTTAVVALLGTLDHVVSAVRAQLASRLAPAVVIGVAGAEVTLLGPVDDAVAAVGGELTTRHASPVATVVDAVIALFTAVRIELAVAAIGRHVTIRVAGAIGAFVHAVVTGFASPGLDHAIAADGFAPTVNWAIARFSVVLAVVTGFAECVFNETIAALRGNAQRETPLTRNWTIPTGLDFTGTGATVFARDVAVVTDFSAFHLAIAAYNDHAAAVSMNAWIPVIERAFGGATIAVHRVAVVALLVGIDDSIAAESRRSASG